MCIKHHIFICIVWNVFCYFFFIFVVGFSSGISFGSLRFDLKKSSQPCAHQSQFYEFESDVFLSGFDLIRFSLAFWRIFSHESDERVGAHSPFTEENGHLSFAVALSVTNCWRRNAEIINQFRREYSNTFFYSRVKFFLRTTKHWLQFFCTCTMARMDSNFDLNHLINIFFFFGFSVHLEFDGHQVELELDHINRE